MREYRNIAKLCFLLCCPAHCGCEQGVDLICSFQQACYPGIISIVTASKSHGSGLRQAELVPDWRDVRQLGRKGSSDVIALVVPATWLN